MRNVLYITYDGLSDSLGQSQILPYLKRLSKNQNIVILSFEKKILYQKEATNLKTIVDNSNLKWIPLDYTKKPPVLSTLYDIIKGIKISKELHNKYNFDIVHCRGYISAIIGRKLQKKFGLKFIFDMRGWWADEKIESGFWNNSIYKKVYQFFKKKEKEFFLFSDYIVSLTYKGRDEIVKQGFAEPEKVGVIPTCVDFEIFREANYKTKQQVRKDLSINENEIVFVYSGSIGGNYDFKTLVSVYKAFQENFSNSYFLILSKDPITENFSETLKKESIERMAIYNVPFKDVTNYLRAADVGFIYYKTTYSTIGRSPTKLGEYWASGLPVISFKGIGDLDLIFEKYPGSGILLSENEDNWKNEIKLIQFPETELLRKYSIDYFSIDKGVVFYKEIYKQITKSTVLTQ